MRVCACCVCVCVCSYVCVSACVYVCACCVCVYIYVVLHAQTHLCTMHTKKAHIINYTSWYNKLLHKLAYNSLPYFGETPAPMAI